MLFTILKYIWESSEYDVFLANIILFHSLHVAGTGYFTSNVSSASNIIAGGYIKGETVKISSGCTLQYDSTQKCVKFVFN